MEASDISIVTKLLNSKCMGTSQDQDEGPRPEFLNSGMLEI